MVTVQAALGAKTGSVDMYYSQALSGMASVYEANLPTTTQSLRVPVYALDDLVAAGQVSAPNLIKMDVEGHEYAVATGALKTIKAAKPVIIFEYNSRAAQLAGWTLSSMEGLLRSCGDYKFYLVDKGTGALSGISTETFSLAEGEYVDVLASESSIPGTL
jgi:hypothetical protein